MVDFVKNTLFCRPIFHFGGLGRVHEDHILIFQKPYNKKRSLRKHAKKVLGRIFPSRDTLLSYALVFTLDIMRYIIIINNITLALTARTPVPVLLPRGSSSRRRRRRRRRERDALGSLQGALQALRKQLAVLRTASPSPLIVDVDLVTTLYGGSYSSTVTCPLLSLFLLVCSCN